MQEIQHEQVSSSPLACLSNLGPHDHPCLIYETPDEQADAYVPYLHAGLAKGELCVYVVDETHPEFIRSAFRARGIDVEPWIRSGAFRIITKHDAYLKEGYFDIPKMMQFWKETVEQALQSGFNAVRAAAEMTWALGNEPGTEHLVPYESELNEVFPNFKVSALCQYHRKRFPAHVIKDMIHIHPIVVAGSEMLVNPGVMSHDEFIYSHDDLEVQKLLDTIELANRLQQRNSELEEALAAKTRATAKVVAQTEEVRKLNEELHSLARIVSHELQEPIAKIRSYLSLLSVRYKGQLGSDADEFIETCTQSAKVVHRMIDDLWLFARMTKVPDSDIPVISVGSIVAGVVEEYQDAIHQTRAKVNVEKLPRLAYSERQLSYLFDSMLNNALTHRSPDVGPEVTIDAKPDGDEWIFSITDNGVGIDPVHYRDVFRAFYRINARPGEKGTGMGLAICQKIVQSHGGRIWVESKLGHGSTFCFSVPANPFASVNQ